MGDPEFVHEADLDGDIAITSTDMSEWLTAWTEFNQVVAECSDGIDNDSDGLSDWCFDPGCGAPDDPLEDPACDDGIDNDGDGFIDMDDPHCDLPFQIREDENPGCGLLGFEAALVLLFARRPLRRRARAMT